eukprot:scaffold1265_cov366-Prasinococcus_capsulatus_cf.AAC.22
MAAMCVDWARYEPIEQCWSRVNTDVLSELVVPTPPVDVLWARSPERSRSREKGTAGCRRNKDALAELDGAKDVAICGWASRPAVIVSTAAQEDVDASRAALQGGSSPRSRPMACQSTTPISDPTAREGLAPNCPSGRVVTLRADHSAILPGGVTRLSSYLAVAVTPPARSVDRLAPGCEGAAPRAAKSAQATTRNPRAYSTEVAVDRSTPGADALVLFAPTPPCLRYRLCACDIKGPARRLCKEGFTAGAQVTCTQSHQAVIIVHNAIRFARLARLIMAASATQTNFPELFEPLQAGELKLKNRIILAPMTRARSQGRVPNSANVEYYRQRAGAGLLITEATTISEVANGWADSPGIYTEEQAEGWKKVVDAVHEEGSQIICQLWHIGRASHSSFMPEGESIVSASAIAIEGEGVYGADIKKHPHEVPRALETEEVEATVEDYGKAAEFAKAAGFDGVEIHGANGYLIDQFLQSCSNVREDKYGGDVEGRFTFCKEIIERVLQVYPAGRVGIRLSPNGAYNGMGAEDNFESFLYVFLYTLGRLRATRAPLSLALNACTVPGKSSLWWTSWDPSATFT